MVHLHEISQILLKDNLIDKTSLKKKKKKKKNPVLLICISYYPNDEKAKLLSAPAIQLENDYE